MSNRKATKKSPRLGEPGRGDAGQTRAVRSRERVLATTFDLLYEAGLGLSVDEVSRRSGVAKTTIYRHWPTRAALVLEACMKLTPEPRVPDHGSFARDVSDLVESLAKLLNTARWTAVLPSIVDAAERDAESATVLGQIQAGHAAPFREVVRRAQHRGELAKEIDPGTMVAMLIGPLFYRRWFSREPIGKVFIQALIRQAVGEGCVVGKGSSSGH